MKLIVGLGNPGKEYEGTRHNAGFEFVNKMAGGDRFGLNKKFEAEILEKDGLILVKPQTFMNESGRAVRKIVDFYKLSLDSLVIVHDDLDINLGEFKIQKGVGPKVHNGIASVEQSLGETNFWRVRLGIDNRKIQQTNLSGADYVLSRFGQDEREVFKGEIGEAIEEFGKVIK